MANQTLIKLGKKKHSEHNVGRTYDKLMFSQKMRRHYKTMERIPEDQIVIY